MITIAFHESALTKLSDDDFEFMQRHKDKLCVIPTSIRLDGREINLEFTYDAKYREKRSRFINNYYKNLGATNHNNIEFVAPGYFEIWNLLFASGNDILYLQPSIDADGVGETIQTIIQELGAKFPDRRFGIINTGVIGSEYGKSVVRCLEFLNHNPPFDVFRNITIKRSLKTKQWFFVDNLGNVPNRKLFKNLHWVLFDDRIAYGRVEQNRLVIDGVRRPYGAHSVSNRGPIFINMAHEIIDVAHQDKATEIVIEGALNWCDMDRITHILHGLDEKIIIKTSGQLEPTTAAYLGVRGMVITLR